MAKNDAPWKKRQEIPDAQVRDAADDYEAASRVLYKALRREAVVLACMNTVTVAIRRSAL
jgi:hypothetical protein